MGREEKEHDEAGSVWAIGRAVLLRYDVQITGRCSEAPWQMLIALLL